MRSPVLTEKGEGDPNQVRSLHTKVGGHIGMADLTLHPPSHKTNRQNPFSVNGTRGKIYEVCDLMSKPNMFSRMRCQGREMHHTHHWSQLVEQMFPREWVNALKENTKNAAPCAPLDSRWVSPG